MQFCEISIFNLDERKYNTAEIKSWIKPFFKNFLLGFFRSQESNTPELDAKFSKIVHCASVYVTVCCSTCAWQEKNSFLWVNQALQASIKVLHIEIARSLEKLFCAEISHQLSLAKTGPP